MFEGEVGEKLRQIWVEPKRELNIILIQTPSVAVARAQIKIWAGAHHHLECRVSQPAFPVPHRVIFGLSADSVHNLMWIIKFKESPCKLTYYV
jgi:hypothetical protein